MSDGEFLGTQTGELYQPVRFHYRVFDRKALLKDFRKLKCLRRDPTALRWFWLYEHEAQSLQFDVTHDKISARMRPEVLGTFLVRSEDMIVLDLASIKRALTAIEFFDKHISRNSARAIEVEIVNRLFTREESDTHPERFFNAQNTPLTDPQAVGRHICEMVEKREMPTEETRRMLDQYLEDAKKPLPDVERFPIDFYERGLMLLESDLKMRHVLAIEHAGGNTSATMYDRYQKMVDRLSKP